MQYQPGTEKVAMMGSPYAPTTRPLTLAEDPQVQRARKVLLIMFGICLVLCLVNTTFAIVNRTENSQGRAQLGLPVMSILFFGFGILVSYRYYETGLRVFAWLGVIMLIGMGIVLGFLLITVLAGLAMASIALVAINSIDENLLTNSTVVNSTALNSADKTAIKGAAALISAYMLTFFFICVSIFVFTIIMVTYAFKLARLIEAKKRVIIQKI